MVAAQTEYPEAPMPQSWEVAVFENPTPNAFALPGGKIGVHSGLLEIAENQAQLATVVGHEIAHVLADHGNERLTQELGLQAGMLLIGLFTESEIAEDQIQQALGIGAQLGITLPFSRAHEEEADLMGLEIMARAASNRTRVFASGRIWRGLQAHNRWNFFPPTRITIPALPRCRINWRLPALFSRPFRRPTARSDQVALTV